MHKSVWCHTYATKHECGATVEPAETSIASHMARQALYRHTRTEAVSYRRHGFRVSSNLYPDLLQGGDKFTIQFRNKFGSFKKLTISLHESSVKQKINCDPGVREGVVTSSG
jgi:hypothetical protein